MTAPVRDAASLAAQLLQAGLNEAKLHMVAAATPSRDEDRVDRDRPGAGLDYASTDRVPPSVAAATKPSKARRHRVTGLVIGPALVPVVPTRKVLLRWHAKHPKVKAHGRCRHAKRSCDLSHGHTVRLQPGDFTAGGTGRLHWRS